MVILYPDYLIASTNIADSFVCLRRNVLKERVKTVGDASLPLLYGNILHELFQHALEHNSFSTEFLQERSEVLLKRRIMDLYTIRHKLQKEGGIEGVRAHIQTKLAKIQEWARKFVSHHPKVILRETIDIRLLIGCRRMLHLKTIEATRSLWRRSIRFSISRKRDSHLATD
jgi:hypothetical protein